MIHITQVFHEQIRTPVETLAVSAAAHGFFSMTLTYKRKLLVGSLSKDMQYACRSYNLPWHPGVCAPSSQVG